MKPMILPRDKKLRPRSCELRSNATPEENKLWYGYLRGYPIQFNRQRIIGEYIVDFYCSKARLVIELDGQQHSEPKQMEYDAIRTQYLECLEIKVMRFENRDVSERFDRVCSLIDNAVRQRMDEMERS